MTDFNTFDFATLDDVEAETCGDRNFGVPPEDLPLNYYDNEDGFWDEFIEFKQ